GATPIYGASGDAAPPTRGRTHGGARRASGSCFVAGSPRDRAENRRVCSRIRTRLKNATASLSPALPGQRASTFAVFPGDLLDGSLVLFARISFLRCAVEAIFESGRPLELCYTLPLVSLNEPSAHATSLGFNVGDIVGERYQIHRLIGRGGMGVVYEAEHV